MKEPALNNLQDLIFVPDWARQPANANIDVNLASARETAKKPKRRSEQRADRFSKRDAGSGTPRLRGPHKMRDALNDGKHEIKPSRNPAHADQPRHSARTSRGVAEAPASALPCRISFIPERRGLKPLVALFRRTRRAWPLNEVARMFLSKPEFYAVKLETTASDVAATAPVKFYQCTECNQVFQEESLATTHLVQKHFDLFFNSETQAGAPPKGNFTAVARCGISGVLLGPPNYHLYAEKIQEIHRDRFASMSLDAYRRHIVNETDPELLEQWKREVALQTVYRTKREPEEQVFHRRFDAENLIITKYLPQLIRSDQRFIIPGTVASELEDQVLLRAIRQIWQKETRSPLRITVAVRPAFRQLGLHLFRSSEKTVYVSAIAPNPLDGAHATPEVEFILQHLKEHPSCVVDEMTAVWSANGGAPDVIARELHWLVDKGHVVTLFDNKLILPPVKQGTVGSKIVSDETQDDLSVKTAAV